MAAAARVRARHGLTAVLELLLPRTDAGVAAQLGLLAVVVGLALRAAWHRPELRLLVAGGGLTLLGLLGLRAAH